MKNPLEVIRMKEQEILRVKKEIEALKVAARLLIEDGDAVPTEKKPELRQVIPMN